MFIYVFSIVTIAFASIFIGFIIATVSYRYKESCFQIELANKDYKINIIEDEYNELVDKHNKLVYRYNSLINKNNNKAIYNKDVIDAIRFAMIQSHPDKGICSNNDNFIKFRRLYNKIK